MNAALPDENKPDGTAPRCPLTTLSFDAVRDSAPTGGPDPLTVADELIAFLSETSTEPRPDPQLEALMLAVAADLPVLLWGEPGIGKTSAITQLAEALNLPLTTVIASVHEPSDFAGLPVVGDDPAVHGVPLAPPDWAVRLVREGRGVAFATAADASRDVLSLLVRGTVGDGPGLELLASLDRLDLPDPETLLADPTAAALPDRGDLRQAVLDAVVDAVRRQPDRSRWDAAWAVLVHALDTGAPDLLVVPASTLAALRQPDWDLPEAIDRFSGVVALRRRADSLTRGRR